MAAAAYKTVLSVTLSNGAKKSIPMTASDVSGAYWLFPSGGNEVQIDSGACVITDITYTSAGTDTSAADLYVNGFFTGYRLFNGANTISVLNRQVQNTPIGIKAGALVKFIQVT